MKLVRMTVLVGAMCLAGLSASAVAKPAVGTPNATGNPGSAHVPTLGQARAVARSQCQEFKANFADSPQQFGKCVAAGVRVLRTSRVTPHQACGDLGLSHKREAGEPRSDFNACVVAAAHGAREGEEGGGEGSQAS
jgi:hypothetical protein